jgi:hypothetical protein
MFFRPSCKMEKKTLTLILFNGKVCILFCDLCSMTSLLMSTQLTGFVVLYAYNLLHKHNKPFYKARLIVQNVNGGKVCKLLSTQTQVDRVLDH